MSPQSPAPAANASPPDEPFQPGQLGMRHILGAMTVAAIILGVSAARLRTLTYIEGGQVAIHWLYVLVVAGGGYFIQVLWRRRIERAAGEKWLRVMQKPVTPSRRRVIRWLLTAAVVIDGVFISLMVAPGRTLGDVMKTPYIFTVLIQLPMMEGWLWLACIRHWLANVYWVEFREHGILLYTGFIPWKSISRIAWSSVHPQRLVMYCNRQVMELPIEPAAREVVSRALEKVRLVK